MKARTLLIPLVLLTPLAAQEAPAAAKPAAAQAAAKPRSPSEEAFSNLPEATRTEFAKHVQEASRLFQQKRIFETLEEIDKAEKIFADNPDLLNLRGSCYVEMRAFDKALATYQKARSFAADTSSIDFNIGEVFFVTKEWQKSLDKFSEIMKVISKENIALSRLVEFKIMLCKKKLGQKEEAAAMAEKYDFLDDSPYYYYAQAALAYDDGMLVKAEEWLAMARRIFQDPNVLAPWQDTLVEYGYIKSFYGDDTTSAEK